MKEHKYFSIGNASAFANPDDGLCIFAGDAPKRTGENTTSHSLRAPFVLISSIVSDRQDMAEILEELLNQNAHRFFSSAANAHGQIEEPALAGDTVSAADTVARLTQENEDLRIRNLELEDAVAKMQDGIRAIQQHQTKRRK